MTQFPSPHHVKVVRMIRDYWELHPEHDLDHLELEGGDPRPATEAYRQWLYDRINTASDGELETLVDRSQWWLILVGFAGSGAKF